MFLLAPATAENTTKLSFLVSFSLPGSSRAAQLRTLLTVEIKVHQRLFQGNVTVPNTSNESFFCDCLQNTNSMNEILNNPVNDLKVFQCPGQQKFWKWEIDFVLLKVVPN